MKMDKIYGVAFTTIKNFNNCDFVPFNGKRGIKDFVEMKLPGWVAAMTDDMVIIIRRLS
jgi:hypothetical protein